MRTEKENISAPASIIQVYKQAFDCARRTDNPDDKIRAYAMVIDFCANSVTCRWNPNIKRNMLLYWAHNNIAQAFKEKNRPQDALKYWQKAIYLAGTNRQKAAVWEQMLDTWGEAPVGMVKRCEEIIKISTDLAKIYMQEGQLHEVIRLEKLKEKVSSLLEKADG